MSLSIDYEVVDAIARVALVACFALSALASALAVCAMKRGRAFAAAGLACATLSASSLLLSIHARTCYAVPEMARLDVLSTEYLLPCTEGEDGAAIYVASGAGGLSVLTESGPRTYSDAESVVVEDEGAPRFEMVECSTEPRGRCAAFEVTGRIVETDPVAYIYIPDVGLTF